MQRSEVHSKSGREVGKPEQSEFFTAVYRQVEVTPRDARAVAGQKDNVMLAVVQLGGEEQRRFQRK